MISSTSSYSIAQTLHTNENSCSHSPLSSPCTSSFSIECPIISFTASLSCAFMYLIDLPIWRSSRRAGSPDCLIVGSTSFSDLRDFFTTNVWSNFSLIFLCSDQGRVESLTRNCLLALRSMMNGTLRAACLPCPRSRWSPPAAATSYCCQVSWSSRCSHPAFSHTSATLHGPE